MNEKSINEQYISILKLVDQKRMREALTQLESYLWQCPDHALRTRLEQLQTSYNYMLQYMKEGVDDPERKKLYRKLLISTLEIADQARLSMLDEVSTRYYHECRKRRTQEIAPYTTGKLMQILESFNDNLAVGSLISEAKRDEALQLHENTLKFMFLQTWSNSFWSVEDETEADNMLASSLVTTSDLSLFTAAATLSLMECFDIRKLTWLCRAYRHDNVQINQRALVGLAIAFILYGNRIELYPEMTERFELLNEELPFETDIARVYRQLLLCQETEKIDKKMREEIIPEMLKNVSSMRGMKFGFEESDEEKDDKNPDWGNIFEQSGLGDKLREMNELQMEGADVYMSTFSALKSFPFFREPHHWFYPFDKHQEDVLKVLSKNKAENTLMDMLLSSGFFCNSDKYSLFFIMQQFPESQRNMIFSQMTDQQMEELAEQTKMESLKKFSERPTTISTQYLQDLYRFFSLNVRRHEFKNIFKEKIELHKLPILKNMLNNEQTLATLADYHFRKEHWKETIELGLSIEQLNGSLCTQAEFYQKIGYALQKEKRFDEAIATYLKADTLRPDNLWTNRHLAICYRQIRNFNKALEYYRKASEVAPDNTNLVFYTASCLAELGQYEEALNYFFKLDFMETNSLKAWRGIGWCSFVSGKHEQAMKYYTKLIEQKPLAVDFLNAGHVAWTLGDIKKAAGLYGKAAEISESRDAFIEMFYKDKDYLIAQGIQASDMPLIIDLI